jgi:hypothetical protein
MEALKARMVLFGAVAALACHGDPTGNEGTPTDILAQPKIVYVPQGSTKPVVVTVLDEDGQALQADFTISNVGPGITVAPDPTFLEVATPNQIRRQARFNVTAVELAASSFVVNALGLSDTVLVTSIPAGLAATISDTAPALGDTISITAPAGTFFTAASTVTFEGAMPFIVSQDATTITFIPAPNTNGPAVVSEVGVASDPDLTFDLPTTTTVRTDSLVDIGAGLSSTAPALGAPVTLTLPAGIRVIPESLPSLTVAGSDVAPINVTVSPDSGTITFTPPPNADSTVVVPGIIPQRLAQCCTATRIIGTDTIPGYALALPTTARVTTPVFDVVPSTVSDVAPDVNESVTLTSTDPQFTFGPGDSVLVGASAGAVSSASGNSITFTAPPGATGPITLVGVELAGFSLTLPSSAPPVTVSSVVPTLAGTTDPGTAPTVLTPDEGFSSALSDLPPFNGADIVDAYYEFVVTEAGDYTITMNWDIGDDLDMYLCPAAGVATFDCDFQAALANHPEIGVYSLTPGTYYIVADDFAAYDEESPGVPDLTTAPAVGATLQITIDHAAPAPPAPPAAPALRAALTRKSSVRKQN